MRLQTVSAFLLCALIVIGPAIVFSQSFDPRMRDPLVPCNGIDCTCQHLATMANRLLTYSLYIMMFVSAIAFIYAGFQYLTAQGDTTKVRRSTTMLTGVAKGLALALVAWLIVDTIVKTLTKKEIYDVWSQICS